MFEKKWMKAALTTMRMMMINQTRGQKKGGVKQQQKQHEMRAVTRRTRRKRAGRGREEVAVCRAVQREEREEKTVTGVGYDENDEDEKRNALMTTTTTTTTTTATTRGDALRALAATTTTTAMMTTSTGVPYGGGVSPAFAAAGDDGFSVPVGKSWEKLSLPIEDGVIMLDVGFIPGEPGHGFVVGTRQTVLETFDYGKTWEARFLGGGNSDGSGGDDEAEFNFRFNAVSWGGSDGREGWIVGKPAVLFRSTDAGSSWKRVPLSTKLPGIPLGLTAFDEDGSAEMVTDQGAIYATNDGGKTWKARVKETVDATLNREVSSGISGASFYTGTFASITRSNEGKYVAVNSRGNFYMTWEPGSDYWQPHNRSTARRLTNMGWNPSNTMWMLTRGGAMYFAKEQGITEDFDDVRIGSRGFGLLDIGYRTEKDCWASGGSGSLFHSVDGGNSWKRERAADDLGGNLYLVKFIKPDLGFVLGSDSILLRYIGLKDGGDMQAAQVTTVEEPDISAPTDTVTADFSEQGPEILRDRIEANDEPIEVDVPLPIESAV